MRYLKMVIVALDCAGNVLVCIVCAILTLDVSLLQDSWNTTLSAHAGRMAEKHQPYFWWTASAIDAVFGVDHCKNQLAREQASGGVWASFNSPSA
jgi:hypothetical protein